jgi:hypothetical protein
VADEVEIRIAADPFSMRVFYERISKDIDIAFASGHLKNPEAYGGCL